MLDLYEEFVNTKDVIDTFISAKRPLSPELIKDMIWVNKQAGKDLAWIVAGTICLICNYEELSIMPANLDIDEVHCTNCKAKQMEYKEETEW